MAPSSPSAIMRKIVEANDPALGIPASGWAESLGQILQISSISGNNLSLVYPLRMTYQGQSVNSSIRKVKMVQNVGVRESAAESGG